MLPLKSVIACASRSWRPWEAASSTRRRTIAWMFRSKAGANPVGCGGDTVGPSIEDLGVIGRLGDIRGQGSNAPNSRAAILFKSDLSSPLVRPGESGGSIFRPQVRSLL